MILTYLIDRRERTGLRLLPGQKRIRKDKRKDVKFTGAQGKQINFTWIIELPGHKVNKSISRGYKVNMIQGTANQAHQVLAHWCTRFQSSH